MTKEFLTIATRESPLALWQANWVKQRLEQHSPGLSVKLLGLTTRGDTIQDVPLLKVGGKSLFVKELEEALLDGRADIAVHSMKDVPMVLPPGLCLAAMCEREEARDAFVSNAFVSLASLPKQALMGTSSLRRQSQVLALRPDLRVVHLRGNVNTRLMRLDRAEYDAVILAAAGLIRLNLAERMTSLLSLEESLPAAGQGVLGIECREEDFSTQALLAPLNHMNSSLCVTAERALCKCLGGGCQVPVAAYAEITAGKLYLQGLVAAPDGKLVLRATHTDQWQHAEKIGEIVANDLLQQGAGNILQALS